MACNVLTSAAVLAAVMVSATTLRPALAQNTAQPPTTAPTPAAEAGALTNSVPALLGVLGAPENSFSPAERDEAAKRLMAIGTPEATDALQKALVNTGNVRGQAAVAREMADGPVPDPIYVDPLRDLIGNDTASSEAAARALANMRGDARARVQLLDAARDEGHRLRDASRAAVIRALAPLANKQAAELLVGIVTNEADPAAVRNAAADELAEMSGDATRGRDPQLWKGWWANYSGKPDAEFEREMLEIRARRLDRIEPKLDRIVLEMREAYRQRFQDAPADARESILLGYLRSSEGEVRAVGATLIGNLFTESKPIPPEAQKYLRSLVGDSEDQVRLEVAATLRDINDRGAVDALVAQLKVERVAAVRVGLAQALVQMGDVREVQPLLALLKDDNPMTVQTAAQALEGLRERLQQKDPKLASEISQALEASLQRVAQAGNGALRESIVSAMVAWASPETRRTFVELVKPNESPRMRRHALEYFGQMGAFWPAADNIVFSGALDDPDATIRLAAVEALGLTAKAQHAQHLYAKLNPETERDERARTAAWNALAAMFPREFSVEQLNQWADRFTNEPDRRLTILLSLQQKLMEANADKDDLAAVRQNVGAVYMELKQYGKAAASFKLALDTPGQQNQVKEFLITQLLEAYLFGKDFEKATQFGSEIIAQDVRNQSKVGIAFNREARRLGSAEGEANDAMRLIDLALKMDPPLADNYARQLRELEPQLRAKAQDAQPAPATP